MRNTTIKQGNDYKVERDDIGGHIIELNSKEAIDLLIECILEDKKNDKQ